MDPDLSNKVPNNLIDSEVINEQEEKVVMKPHVVEPSTMRRSSRGTNHQFG